jgi:hypothetical protein
MKEVVARLREDSVEALLEVFELDVAVGELVLAAQTLAALANDLAGEAAQLADTPLLASSARLRSLADGARRASETAQTQAGSLLQLKYGLDAWNIVPDTIASRQS